MHGILETLSFVVKKYWWQSFSAVGLAVVLYSSARGLRFPNAYAISHWLYSYDFGFIKRGLVGQLVQPLLSGKKPDEIIDIINWLSAAIFFGFFVTMFWPIWNLTKKMGSIPRLLYLMSCLVVYSSAFVVFMAHITGYFDQLLAIFAFVSVAFIKKNRFLVPTVLTVVGLFIQEIYALVGFPAVVFAVVIRILTNERNDRKSLFADLASKTAYLVIPALCAFALICWSQERMSQTVISDIEQQMEEYGVLSKSGVWWGTYHLSHNISTNWRSERGKAMERITRVDVARSVVPSVAFLLLASAVFLSGAGKLYLLFLLIPVVFCPLTIHFFASDTLRFGTSLIFNAFLALVAIVKIGCPSQTARWPAISLSALSIVILGMNFSTKHTLMDRQIDGQGIFSVHLSGKE